MKPRASAERLPWPWLAALAGLALVIDGSLALRVMGEGDAAEFTLTLALGSVPHPSGYPLYILFGHAFVRTMHALGCSWALAANLWSATGAAVAMLLTAALADRLIPAAPRLGRPARLAIVVAALLALFANPVFVRAATQAEVHSWHVAWVAGSALAALALWRALAGREPLTARRLRAFAFGWGLLTGAGLAHHLTAIFFIVPLGLMLALSARRARRLDAPFALAVLAGVAIPLLSFSLVAWRAFHPAAFQWPALEPTWSGVFAHATGAVYRTFVGGFAPSPAERQLLFGAVAPVVVPGLLAALTVTWRARREADAAPLAALLAAAALQGAFALRYSEPISRQASPARRSGAASRWRRCRSCHTHGWGPRLTTPGRSPTPTPRCARHSAPCPSTAESSSGTRIRTCACGPTSCSTARSPGSW